MNLKSKIIIDRFVGLPVVYSLNILARILGVFLSIDHSLNKPFKIIAVSKFVGMGSIIQATPLLKTLRKNYPEARIIFITNACNQSVFKHIQSVDLVLTISDKGIISLIGSSITLLFKLWKQKPDVYIDLEIYSNYSGIVATASLSKNRMGFYKNDKMYRTGIYTHMMLFNVKSPISQAYLQFARLLNCKHIESDLSLSLNNTDAIFEGIEKKCGLGRNQKYIVINPNASDLRLERRWPKENFIRLIQTLHVEFSESKVVLIGSAVESDYVNSIASSLNPVNLINSCGKLNIEELMTLIANAGLMITNDTGPMHIAFAFKTKTVSLFGPCSPQQYGGANNSITIYKNIYCSPCVHEFIVPPCKGDNQCMKKITMDEVLNTVRTALNSTTTFTNQQSPVDYTNGDAPLGIISR